MPQIKVTPSMALDAICYFDQRLLNNAKRFKPKQLEFIEKVTAECADKLDNTCIGMSTLCMILTAYADNTPFESLNLNGLAQLFKNPEDIRTVVKSRITNEFTASYVFPMLDALVDGWAEKYVNKIKVLEKAGFEQMWETDILPLVQKDISLKNEVYSDINVDNILKDIEKLKQCAPLSDIKIYVSYLSYPVAFTLHNGSFLENAGGVGSVGMLCHELMHGFSTEKLEMLYLNYVKNDTYLTEQHERLINEMSSGNEEEFVMAAEYYLRMKHNGEDKPKLLKEARKRYRGCVPISVLLFDMLSKEIETPNGYAEWLANLFEKQKLPQNNIQCYLDEIAPK